MNVKVAADIIYPKAWGLSSVGMCSPTRVEIIGPTIARASPDTEKARKRMLRLGAKPHPMAEARCSVNPARSSFLGPYLLLIRPANIDPNMASVELSVDICPVIPTGALNDSAISIRSRLDITSGVQLAYIATNKAGNNRRFLSSFFSIKTPSYEYY